MGRLRGALSPSFYIFPAHLLSTVSLRAVGEAIQAFSLLRRYAPRKDIKIKREGHRGAWGYSIKPTGGRVDKFPFSFAK